MTSRISDLAPAGLSLCGLVLGCRPGGPTTSAAPEPEAAPASVASSAPREAGPPNALGLPPANVMAVVNPMNLPPYAGPTGTVEGTVLVRGTEAPDVPGLDVHSCPAALDTYGKLFRAGPSRADGARPLADAVVVITGYGGYYLPEKQEVQRATIKSSCGYETRSIVLTFGQRLEVENDSTVPFAPYLEGEPAFTVMVAAPQRKGEPVKIFPSRADYFSLRDQLQPFVRGDVYVLRQPLHAVTDMRGRFRISGVPTGKLKVGARLAAILGETSKDIEVRADAVESPELVLTYAPKEAAPAKPSNAR